MKSHIVDKRLQREIQDYTAFLRFKDGLAQQVCAAILYSYHMDGKPASEIKDVFDRLVQIINLPPTVQGNFKGTGIVDFLEKTYDLDFKRIVLDAETQDEYLDRMGIQR